MRTIATCILSGKDNNFNILRLLAAAAVLYAHSFPLSSGAREPIGSFTGYDIGSAGVMVFFAISGFLVTKSYQDRDGFIAFIEARFLRIIPALAGLALFCILVIGPIYTTLSLSEFFSSGQTMKFLYTHLTVNRIEMELPGVFQGNSYSNVVNGSLWTLPYEISMYKWVAFLGLASLIRRRAVFNVLYAIMCIIWFFIPPSVLIANAHMRTLSFAFFLGAFFYINREWIPMNAIILIGLLLVAVTVRGTGYFSLAVEGFLAYGALWFAYAPSGIIRRYNLLGDYSYGLYIYAFPVQQSLAATVPGIQPGFMAPAAFLLTLAVGVCSWHLVEKPALQLKGHLAPRLLGILGQYLSVLRIERVKKLFNFPF